MSHDLNVMTSSASLKLLWVYLASLTNSTVKRFVTRTHTEKELYSLTKVTWSYKGDIIGTLKVSKA